MAIIGTVASEKGNTDIDVKLYYLLFYLGLTDAVAST